MPCGIFTSATEVQRVAASKGRIQTVVADDDSEDEAWGPDNDRDQPQSEPEPEPEPEPKPKPKPKVIK